MPNPLENKMLMYYLNTLGQGLMDPEHPMQPVASATKQQMAAESKHKLSMNYMNMIKQMLAGGGKISMDKDKFKLDAPSALLGDVSGIIEKEGAPAGMSMNAPTGMQGVGEKDWMQSFLNPSASPIDVTSADLVGLTPADVTQALQTGVAYGGLERKRLSDIYNLIHKQKVLEAKETRTTKVRNYEYYVAQEKAAGKEFKSMEMWDSGLVRERRLYDEAVASGMSKEENPFHEWLFELRRAGAVSIDMVGREVKKGLGKGQAEVMSPGYAQDVRVDLMKDKAAWPSESLIKRYTDKGLPYAEAEERAQKRMVLESMDKQIRQAFKGKKVTLGEDGWYIDGELKVRYP